MRLDNSFFSTVHPFKKFEIKINLRSKINIQVYYHKFLEIVEKSDINKI